MAPAGHALDVAKVDLALTLANKEWRDREPGADRLSPDVLVETNMLLDEVLGHDAVPPDMPFRDPRREAATLKAQMIHKGELAGTPSDVLALMEDHTRKTRGRLSVDCLPVQARRQRSRVEDPRVLASDAVSGAVSKGD